jgi:hypothetical protein
MVTAMTMLFTMKRRYIIARSPPTVFHRTVGLIVVVVVSATPYDAAGQQNPHRQNPQGER